MLKKWGSESLNIKKDKDKKVKSNTAKENQQLTLFDFID
jgi:hypothetical protein